MRSDRLKLYCANWSLSNPLLMISTLTSDIFKVEFNGLPAILKLLNDKGKKFEVRGAIVLRCFNGNKAVKLLNADEGAHLLEFVDGPQLKTLVERGEDLQATEVICDILNQLHQYSGAIPTELISMERNFRSLFLLAQKENLHSIYSEGAKMAEKLIATEQEIRVLHGDIHHDNILRSSTRGWLVIDPQCLVGERTYDTANTFYNPNGFLKSAATKEVIEQRSILFAQRLCIDQKRILEYAFAYGCLSAAWSIEDGRQESTLHIAQSIREVLTML